MNQFGRIASWATAILLAGAVFSRDAEATFTVNVDEVGSNVVATGSGTIDLTGLNFVNTGGPNSVVAPFLGEIVLGSPGTVDVYTGVTGPSSFGTFVVTFATSSTGDLVAIAGSGGLLAVPTGFVSGGALSDTATWDNATFASLGLTPGTYIYSWGPVAFDDTFVVNIGPVGAVPEPPTLALLVAGLLGMGLSRRRNKAPAAYSRS